MSKLLRLTTSIVLFSLSLPFLCNNVYAQKNFEPGYIITKENSTVKGFIDYRDWVSNPDKITFQQSLSGSSTIYRPEEINGFGIDGVARYKSFLGEVNIAPVELPDLTTSKEPEFKIDTVFLDVLLEGKKNLYYLHDQKGKKHFFIGDEDGDIEELVFIKYLIIVESTNDLVQKFSRELKPYKKQLHHAFQDCSKTVQMIVESEYKIKSLKKIFELYNKCIDTDLTTYNKIQKKIKTRFQLFGGYARTGLSFKGSLVYDLEEFDFSASYRPVFGGAVEFNFPTHRFRHSIVTELLYKHYVFSDDNNNIISPNHSEMSHVDLDFSYLKVNALYRYNILLEGVIPYFKFGFGLGFPLKKDHRIDKETRFFASIVEEVGPVVDNVRSVELSLNGGIGVQVSRFFAELKMEAGNSFYPIGTFSSSAITLGVVIGVSF